MKYFLLVLGFFLAQTCEKQMVRPDTLVTSITESEVHFSDGRIRNFPQAKSSDASIFFLVRHAEKEKDQQDPDLSPEGKARAERLATILKDAGIFKVYSTVYKRTINTALPTIQALDCEQGSFRADKQGEFIETLLKHQKGKRFLIVGHSNTTPALVNHLIGNAVYEDIDHEEYGKLFVVISNGVGNSEVLELKY